MTKKNYEQLPKLKDDYPDLQILAFPCNQFGGQEPGTHAEILSFVRQFDPQMTDKLEFFEKGDVNGRKTRPVFAWLRQELPNAEDGTTTVRWNFTKFLVDHEGKPFQRYGPKTAPDEIRPDIEKLLEKAKAK